MSGRPSASPTVLRRPEWTPVEGVPAHRGPVVMSHGADRVERGNDVTAMTDESGRDGAHTDPVRGEHSIADTAHHADRHFGTWVATGVLAGGVAIDLCFGDRASLIMILVFGPFVASTLDSVRSTAVLAFVAVLLAVALGWPNGTMGSSAHLVRVLAVFAGGSLATWLAVERTRREAKLRSMTRVAEVAQQTILRPVPSVVCGVRLEARYVSASADAKVGGDFYEAVATPFGLRVLVGDVRGKGLEAVRLASLLLGEFRSRASTEPELSVLARKLDEAGQRHADDSGEDFATALLAQLDPPILTLVRCGHPFPMMAKESRVETIEAGASLPLCLGGEPLAEEFTIPGKARILFYSDGVTDSRDREGREFNLEESFSRAASAEKLGDALDRILSDLRTHCANQISDDVVLLLVQVPCEQHENDPARGARPGRAAAAGFSG